jgi:hypothetical protein
MYRMLKKIFTTPLKIMSERDIRGGEVESIGQAIKEQVQKVFGGSIAIRAVAAGSSNAEEQELTALTNAYYEYRAFRRAICNWPVFPYLVTSDMLPDFPLINKSFNFHIQGMTCSGLFDRKPSLPPEKR